MSLQNTSKSGIKEYQIFASKIPTEKQAQPQIFTSTIFAKNQISARSKMNKILDKKHKVKASQSVVLRITEIKEENDEMKIKNYGIQYVYRSKKGLHNMYKEFRGISRCDEVEQLYNDKAGRHNAMANELSVVEVKELGVEELKRMNVIQFTGEDVSYPVFRKKINRDVGFASMTEKIFD